MALNAVDDTLDEVGDAAIKRWHKAQEAVSDLSAITPAGVRAKAAALMTAMRHDVVVKIGGTMGEYADLHEWLAYRLAEDIVALARGAAWPCLLPPQPAGWRCDTPRGGGCCRAGGSARH